MNLDRAIRLARAWAFGGVCSLREGEAQEYHKMALAAIEAQRDGAVPVRHGQWEQGDMYDYGDVCSLCGWDSAQEPCRLPYCPNCGAKMDGGPDVETD